MIPANPLEFGALCLGFIFGFILAVTIIEVIGEAKWFRLFDWIDEYIYTPLFQRITKKNKKYEKEF